MESKRDLWDALRVVPKTATKPFNNGRFSGTDIKPIWRLEKLTETFGPCGFGWYVDGVRFWLETAPNGEVKTNCELSLYVKMGDEWSKPIRGVGGNTFYSISKGGVGFTDDEGYKKAYTDAISVAAKALGIGADIYDDNPAIDDSKYYEFYSGDEKKKELYARKGVGAKTDACPSGMKELCEAVLTDGNWLAWAIQYDTEAKLRAGLNANKYWMSDAMLSRFRNAVMDYRINNNL